jgi:hypothetical protein
MPIDVSIEDEADVRIETPAFKGVTELWAAATAVVPTKHEHKVIFMYGSFKDSINISPYTATNGRAFSEQ